MGGWTKRPMTWGTPFARLSRPVEGVRNCGPRKSTPQHYDVMQDWVAECRNPLHQLACVSREYIDRSRAAQHELSKQDVSARGRGKHPLQPRNHVETIHNKAQSSLGGKRKSEVVRHHI